MKSFDRVGRLTAVLSASLLLTSSGAAVAAGVGIIAGADGYVTIGANGNAALAAVAANGATTVTQAPFLQPVPLTHITATTDTAGNIQVVAVDADGNFLGTTLSIQCPASATPCWPNAATWQALPVAHFGVVSELTLVPLKLNGVDELHLFVYGVVPGPMDQLMHLQANNGAWGAWDQTGPGGYPNAQTPMKPVVYTTPGVSLTAFLVGAGTQQFRENTFNGHWGNWVNPCGPFPEPIMGNPAATFFSGAPLHPQGIGMHLMAIGGTSGTLYQSVAGGAWVSMGQPLGSPGGSPVFVTNGTTVLGVFVIALNNGIWYQNQLPAPSVYWQLISGVFPLIGELTVSPHGFLFYDLPADNVPTPAGPLDQPNRAEGSVALVLGGAGTGQGIPVSFPSGLGPNPDPWVPANNANDETSALSTKFRNVVAPLNDSGWEFLLQDVAGPILTDAANITANGFTFVLRTGLAEQQRIDPDSSNKTLVHTYLYNAMANGTPAGNTVPPHLYPTSTDGISTYVLDPSTCLAKLTGVGGLSTGLNSIASADLAMLKVSSNDDTNNLIHFFDNDAQPGLATNINNYMFNIGAQRYGRGGLTYEDCNEVNDLADFSTMFSQVLFGGILSQPNDRNGTLAHWQQYLGNKSDGSGQIEAMAIQEAAALGLTGAQSASFRDQLNYGAKGGSGGCCDHQQHFTDVGWIEIPFCLNRMPDWSLGMAGGTPTVLRRRMFWGSHMNTDHDENNLINGFWASALEMMRVQIRYGLKNWAACSN